MSNTPEISGDLALLSELEPKAAELFDRHMESTKTWYPHQIVPWSRGRDFEPDYQWDPSESRLPDGVQSALFVNLLTEDNLPYYFRDIERMFGRDGAWGEWARRWTAEEGRHATVIREYLTVTRAIDPVGLEDARMVQMSGGKVPEPPSAADGLVYVSLQELATRISHRRTGMAIKEHDEVGYDIMRRVATDENHHFLFYRGMTDALIDFNPSVAVEAMARQVIGFAMPGEGIPDFDRHARVIAKAGIYDLEIHYEDVLKPVVRDHWGIESLGGLTSEAELARERVIAHMAKSERVARRLAERKEERNKAAESN